MSFISAGNTTTTTLVVNGDTTGNLVFNTGGANTTALTITNAQNATFANTVTATGGFIVGASAAPAFSAYQGTAQSIGATLVKITIDTKEFDTATAFNTSTYRFTPLVAGYYQVNGTCKFNGTVANALISIYKNGGRYKDGNFGGSSTVQGVGVAAIIYLNGSTDYVELYGYQSSGVSVNTAAGTTFDTYFNAAMVRSA